MRSNQFIPERGSLVKLIYIGATDFKHNYILAIWGMDEEQTKKFFRSLGSCTKSVHPPIAICMDENVCFSIGISNQTIFEHTTITELMNFKRLIAQKGYLFDFKRLIAIKNHKMPKKK